MQSLQQSPQLGPTSPSIPSNLSSPTRSRSSSRGSHLALDLSNIPPLTQPSVPTNTLLITNLKNLEIFNPIHLSQLRQGIDATAPTISWSPLKSFRRIVCSFATTEDATTVRQALDGESIMGDRARVFFGEHTPLQPIDQHLHAPESKKLFFISPPPSPPHGWEIKNEAPPNATIVAEDLAFALAKLNCNTKPYDGNNGKLKENRQEGEASSPGGIRRPRSASSVLLYEPEEQDGARMPAISVDDYTDSGDEASPVSPVAPASFHTSRPPVELINDI